jgi:type II secretory pathway pseudopilin PulG
MTPPLHPSSAGERGFTLVEMLVALVTGIVVVLATLSVLDISVSQSSRIAERVDADQQGRLAMEKIMLELHSSCTAYEATPVREESTGEKLELVSQPSSKAYLTRVTKHVIAYNEATHTLTDASFNSTNTLEQLNTPWNFSGTATGTQTLLTGVYKSTIEEGGVKKTVPVFQYFKYVGGGLSGTPMAASPLGKENAENTAEVTVSFTTAPTSGRTSGDRTVDLSDSAVLRYDPASATGANEPCA